MSATRDPDQLIEAFLEEGPAVMPDRVLYAVRDDIHDQRQRTVFGPWRFITMHRAYLAAAGVAAVIAIGAVAGLWLTRPSDNNVGGATPTPTPSRIEVRMPLGALESGTRYVQGWFNSPLALTVPATTGLSAFEGDQPFKVDVWDFASFRMQIDESGAITFHDDARIPDDLCHPTDSIADVPPTPQAVGEWLASGEGIDVSEPIELTVGGRTALAFDVRLGADCSEGGSQPGNPAFSFSRDELHRIFAVPTGDDTILIVTWLGGLGQQRLDAFNAAADQVVKSITFK